MLRLLLSSLALLVVTAALADDRQQFVGTWGTDKQCARKPIKEGGTVLAKPFVISREWLRHGELWCKLNWFSSEQRQNSIFSGAFAQCGEDSVRGYLLGLELKGEELTIRWNFPHKNGPLKQCPSS